MVSGDLRLTIVVLIEQYLATSRDRIECEQARAYEALPIFRGWDGTTLFLRHDGEILAIHFELGHQEVRIEAGPHLADDHDRLRRRMPPGATTPPAEVDGNES
ncbi:hypothetical protein [Singulisphaera sp. PoT]|uniref:hypothetical protein n=1 Tax=Singulisphaera sp. PoT TaxID=3411797 RepID=UPI003BF4E417